MSRICWSDNLAPKHSKISCFDHTDADVLTLEVLFFFYLFCHCLYICPLSFGIFQLIWHLNLISKLNLSKYYYILICNHFLKPEFKYLSFLLVKVPWNPKPNSLLSLWFITNNTAVDTVLILKHFVCT